MQPFSSAMSEATVVISQMAALYMHIKKGLIKWDKAAPRSSYPYIVHPLAYTGQFINYNNTMVSSTSGGILGPQHKTNLKTS